MKKYAIRGSLGFIGFLFVVMILANVFAPPPLPPPDPHTPIRFPDGDLMSLEEVLTWDHDREQTRKETQSEEGELRFDREQIEAAAQDALRQIQEDRRFPYDLFARENMDLLDIAEYQIAQNDVPAAIALLRSIPDDHPKYARAQRYLGWDVFTRELEQPGQGLRFVNASLLKNPVEGNAWQDAYRVYLRAITPDW